MRTLAVVPARGGSKGLPGKNARLFLGESLLGRAIRIALETCDDVVVTTDDPGLAEIAHGYRVPVRIRTPELATDEAPMLPVVQDAIRGREGDVIVLLQPTQPLRTAEQVRRAIDRLKEAPGLDSVVSVREIPERFRPDLVMHVHPISGNLTPATGDEGWECGRRQDARRGYVRCGTVYATRRGVVQGDNFIRGGDLYGLSSEPLILEGDALSIDTLEDFERLEAMALPDGLLPEPVRPVVSIPELLRPIGIKGFFP
jgi:CMP-N,N'-diacetyllegionaminic acid synthase